MSEYEVEPVRGLPERLPAGERMLWQGAPDWRILARRTFHVRKVAFYFGLLFVWGMAAGLHDGESLAAAARAASPLLVLALLAVGLLTLLAWLASRTTVYTITNRRLVMRFGVAMPMTVNIPFRQVEGAALRIYGNGSGDIPLSLSPDERVSYLIMWPHVRPWRIGPPQPMLRAVPNASETAEILAGALAAASALPEGRAVRERDSVPSREPEPRSAAAAAA